MELNTKAIQEVVQLNLDLLKVNNQIGHVKGLINQLLLDKCDLSVSFKMHNETRCEENKADQYGNNEYAIMDDILRKSGFFAMSGHPISAIVIPKEPQKECKNTLNFDVTDTDGVRILSILLAEKEEAKRLMIDRMNQLINPIVINFPAAGNPIHDRYTVE